MTIAYLVNRYPTVSHSFIRREILGLESAGIEVRRFTIRESPTDLPDRQDQAEAAKTQAVLAQGMAHLLFATLRQAVRHPVRWLKAFRMAVGMGQGAPVRIVRQMAYLIEACWLARQMRGVRHLHAHFGTNPAAVARLTHVLSNIPYSFTVHGPEEFDGPLSLDLPGKIKDARSVIAISSFGRSQLMRWTNPADWGKLLVVRCGIDATFAEAEVQPLCEAPELSCVARLSGQKGLPLLIEAAAVLKRRGVVFHLTIVGDGEMRDEIEQAIHSNDLAEQVTITGYLSAEGVRSAVTASRAMILPSFAEGLPVVIMEALALRTPVIVTQIAGTPELVDSTCGWLIPAGRVDVLADAMQAALAAAPATLRAMGEIGRGRALEQHDSVRNARALGEAVGVL